MLFRSEILDTAIVFFSSSMAVSRISRMVVRRARGLTAGITTSLSKGLARL